MYTESHALVKRPDYVADEWLALVGLKVHIRIFAGSGKKVVDKPQPELVSGEELTNLKAVLNKSPFPDVAALPHEESQTIVNNAASTAGHPRAKLTIAYRPAYPDLWIDKVVSQEDINAWLGYSSKSWPLQAWYQNALRNGCPRADLNELFDWIVFENLDYVTSELRALEKYGNLRCSKVNPHYIGKLTDPDRYRGSYTVNCSTCLTVGSRFVPARRNRQL